MSESGIDSGFAIPRARAVIEGRLAGGGKKPARTASGKSVTATDYLNGYRPKQKALQEEGD